MRFLMVPMRFPVEPGQSYLTTELADALVGAGHDVEVLHLDWDAPPGAPTQVLTTANGVRVVRCAPRCITGAGALLRDASKFLLSGRHLGRVARQHLALERFDALIAWMPAVAIAPLLPLVRRAGLRHRLLFIWDFFPDHHREIGRIPAGPAYAIAKAWEQQLLAHFTAIFCTLPGNADYLRRNYRLRADQRVLVTPVWGDVSGREPVDRAAMRARHGLPADRPIAVFGGQLVEGRGFEQMLGAAASGEAEGSPLLFLFVGEGRLADGIRARAESAANVAWRPGMPREDYLDLLGACDVGMVATVPGVSSFSIPSKTVDYLRAGLPVIAAVEHGSHFIGILERYQLGRAVPFGDPAAFLAQAELLATDRQLRAAAQAGASRCLAEVFDVAHAVSAVMAAVRP
jgi:glycosyltransferase involved in cell wall biosynthesis